MKKTLITLAALAMASVAQAADYTLLNNVDFSSSSGEYTMILDLNWKAAQNLNGWNNGATDTWAYIQIGANGTDGMYWNHGIKIFKGGEGLAVALWVDGTRRSDLTSVTGTPFRDSYETNSIFVNSDNVVNGVFALTLSVKDEGTKGLTFTLGVLENNETVSLASWSTSTTGGLTGNQNISGWDPGQGFDSIKVTNAPEGLLVGYETFNTVLEPTALNAAATQFVPEPTTATLSLLALAGLAARRRRK